MKTVVLEELAILSWVIAQLTVGDEIMPTISSIINCLLFGHSSVFRTDSSTKVCSVCTGLILITMIDHLHSDFTAKRPFQILIKLSSHKTDIR